MRRQFNRLSRWLFVVGSSLVSTSGVRAQQPSTPNVRPGQSPNEVRDRLGPPVRVARQVLFRRYIEQWVYDLPQPVRVEFSCARGRDPYVSAVLPTPPLR